MQMCNRRRQVFTGTGVIAACQQVWLARAPTPIQGGAGPALSCEGFLQPGHIRRVGRAGQPVQHQHQWRLRVMGPMPVEVEKVAVVQPQAFALAFDMGGRAPQRPPQGLQVGVAEAEGGFEQLRGRDHETLGSKRAYCGMRACCGEQACPALGCEAAPVKSPHSICRIAVPLKGAASQPNAGQACSPQPSWPPQKARSLQHLPKVKRRFQPTDATTRNTRDRTSAPGAGASCPAGRG